MSRSPQNGGFHKCSGGGPLAPARFTAPVMASRAVFASAMHPELAHDLAIVQGLRYQNPAPGSRERDVWIRESHGAENSVDSTAIRESGRFAPLYWRGVCILCGHKVLAGGRHGEKPKQNRSRHG